MKITKKTWIIIAAVAVVVIIAAILIFRRKPEDETEEQSNNTGSAPSSGAGISLLPERGYPIMKGVSKRKEVYDMQVRLVNEYGANVGISGPDGDWGNATETVVLKYLKKNKFNSLGELKAAFAANPGTGSGGTASGVIDTVLNWIG